jgi:hypothetical protein
MADREALFKDLTAGETDPQSVAVFDQTTTPTNEATKAKLYAKDVGGVVKIHALSSDGTEIELGSSVTKLSLAAETTSTTPVNVGSVYMQSGTLKSGSLAFLGTLGGTDEAVLQLVRETGATLITQWDVSGVPVSDSLGSDVALPATDWYHLRLYCTAGGDTARIQGVYLVVEV